MREATKESKKEEEATKERKPANMEKVLELNFKFYKGNEGKKKKKPKKVEHVRYHFYKEKEATKDQDKEKEATKDQGKEKEATKDQDKEKEATKDQDKEKEEATNEILDQFETPWAKFLVQRVNTRWMEDNPDAFKEMELLDEFEVRGTTFMVMKKKELEDKDDEEQ